MSRENCRVSSHCILCNGLSLFEWRVPLLACGGAVHREWLKGKTRQTTTTWSFLVNAGQLLHDQLVLNVVRPIIPIADWKCAFRMLRADVYKSTLSYAAIHGTSIYTTIEKLCVFQCDYVLSPARPLSVDSRLKGILWVSHNKTRHWPHSQPFPELSDEPHFCPIRIFKREKKSFFALA